jgi:hypothetical protein
MNVTNLDAIVRRNLLEKGLPIHFYFEEMLHACSALRELTFDTLLIFNTVELPVSSYFTCDLPDDFSDDVLVGIPIGGLVQPISKRDTITPLRTIDSSGNFVTPVTNPPSDSGGEVFFGLNTNWLWYWNINDYGEPTGRYFGADGGAKRNGYQVFKNRRQIQLTNTFTSQNIVLIYISDGQSADAATQIDTMAHSCITAYINWKRGPNAENVNSPEARYFYNERRKCYSRLDGTTVADVRQIVLHSYQASIKN